MSSTKRLSRRDFLRGAALAAAGAVAAACQPQVVTEVVKETVKETVVVEAEPEIVEKVVTVTPLSRKKVVAQLPPWMAAKLPSVHKWKAEYEAEFPGREVEYLRENFDLTKAMLEASQGASHVDLGFGLPAVLFLAQMVEGNVVAPITDLVPDDWMGLVAQAFIDENSYNGELYGWPYDQVGSLINYRKSMLTQAGHTDAPGDTLEEYLSVCEDVEAKLTTPDGGPVFGNAFDLSWWWRAPTTVGVNMMGVDFFGEDGYMAWDDPRTVDVFHTFKLLAEHAPPEVFEPGYSAVEAFGAGKAAMFLGQSEQVFYLADSTFGMGDLETSYPPVFPGGEENPRTVLVSDGTFMFQHGHLEEAWHFFSWLWPREDFHKAMATEGKWLPVHLEYSQADWVPSLVGDVVGMITDGIAIPTTPNYWEFATHAKAALTDYLLGKIEMPEEAVARAKKDFEEALATGG